MVLNKQPNDDLIRELYARFGLAYYHSECLHRGLCTILAWAVLPQRDQITKPRVEERLAYTFSLTLGDVVRELEGIIPAEHFIKLLEVVDRRNFLAHHFWFERCHLMFDIDHIKQLIAELDKYSELFSHLDKLTSKWFEPRQQELGITDDIIQQHLTQIMSGQPGEPLPDKHMVKKLKKELKCQQRLIRVWEFSLPHGGKPLIFETEGNTFWYLCDVGLIQTSFQNVKPG